MTKEIPLTLGKVALVDDEDFDDLNKYEWCAYKDKRKRTFYAARRTSRVGGGHTTIKMHQQIIGISNGLEVDHINGNGLDNRRSNLRFCVHSQNSCNRGPNRGNISGYKGVSWNKKNSKWRAQICANSRTIYLGCFDFKEDAARAYNEAAKRLHGDFAWLNEIPT